MLFGDFIGNGSDLVGVFCWELIDCAVEGATVGVVAVTTTTGVGAKVGSNTSGMPMGIATGGTLSTAMGEDATSGTGVRTAAGVLVRDNLLIGALVGLVGDLVRHMTAVGESRGQLIGCTSGILVGEGGGFVGIKVGDAVVGSLVGEKDGDWEGPTLSDGG